MADWQDYVGAFRRVRFQARVRARLRPLLDAVLAARGGSFVAVGPSTSAASVVRDTGGASGAGSLVWNAGFPVSRRLTRRGVRVSRVRSRRVHLRHRAVFGRDPERVAAAIASLEIDVLDRFVVHSAQPCARVDVNGRIRTANRSFVQFSGLGQADLSALALLDPAPPGTPQDRTRALVQRVLDHDPPRVRFVERLVDRHGVARVRQWTAVALGPATARTDLVVTGEDLSLGEAEQASIRSALSAVGFGVFDWSVDDNRTYVDPHAVRLLGMQDRSQPTGHEMLDLIHPEDRTRVAHALQDTMERGVPYRQTYRVENTDRWIEWFGGRTDQEGGLHLAGVLREVTDTVRDQEEARERSLLLDNLVRQLPVSLFAFDANGCLTSGRGALLDAVGFDLNRALGASYKRIYRRYPAIQRRVEAALAGTSSHFRDFAFDRWLDIALVAQPGSEATRVVGIAVDVTPQVELEQEKSRGERHEASYLLLAGMAHDFNNLLTVILTYTDLVAHAVGGPASLAARDLQRVRGAAEQAVEIVRRILSLGRDLEGEAPPMDVTSALAGLYETLQRLLSGVSLSLSLGPCPRVRLAPTELEHIAYNLALNARDATPPGGRVSLACRTVLLDAETAATWTLAPGRYCEIEVRDNGRGIPDEVLPSLFEVGVSTKIGRRGSGLGLGTVRAIARRRGGAIQAMNLPEGGASFRILLPAAERPEGARCGAWIVDPDPDLREVVARVLERSLGMTSVQSADLNISGTMREVASSCEIAIIACSAYDGAAVAGVLPQQTPILLLAQLDSEDESVAGIPYLVKPFAMDQFLAGVQALLPAREVTNR